MDAISLERLGLPYVDVVHCGGPSCDKILKWLPQRCSKCRVRSYCSKDCMRQDWNFHKKTCEDLARDHPYARDVIHYDSAHSGFFRVYLLSLLGAAKYLECHPFPTLQTWIPICSTKYLLVTLSPVPDAVGERYNHLRLLVAEPKDIEELPISRRRDIEERLRLRYPAVVIAYRVKDKDGFHGYHTVTHSFVWPAKLTEMSTQLMKLDLHAFLGCVRKQEQGLAKPSRDVLRTLARLESENDQSECRF